MHTSPVNSENIQTKWHGALDAEVKVNVSEIRNKEEFNNINLDLKALEAFTPNRYYKAACIEKTFSFSRTSAEIADPMFTPMVMKSVIDSSDLMHHWKQSYQNLWRSLMDRIIVAEKASLHEMQQLLKCKHFFENIDWPLNTLMSCDEEDAVFFNIDEILTVTSTFVSRIEAMSPGEWVLGTIYNVYYDLVMKHLCLFNSYADNRPKAQQIIDKKGGATVFNEIVDDEFPEFTKLFTDLLDTPLIMRSRVYYSLKVLCGFVLAYHPDYSFLYELVIKLSQVPNICQTPDENIIALPLRNGFVVQKVKNTRKLRYLFLFPNYLIITSVKRLSGNVYFKVNQAIHLGVNMVNSVTNTSVIDLRERHFEDCKKALNRVKEDLRIKLLIPRKSRGQLYKCKLNKLLKKAFEYECRITLLFPHLKLIVADVDNQKQYQFLFASYFQLEMWKQMLNDNNYPHSNIHEYFTCINQYCQITRIPDANFSEDEMYYYDGVLDVIVHQVRCLVKETDSYVTLQVDSFGGYFTKIYKTDIVPASQTPVYDTTFQLPLFCSENLKLSLYTLENNEFRLTFSGILNFESSSLSTIYQFFLIPMYMTQTRVSAAVSVRYFSNFNKPRRNMSVIENEALDYIVSMRGPVFGESLETISEREKRDVPLIVQSCVEYIETNGLDVENTYNVDGDENTLEELIGVFDICSFTGAMLIKNKRYGVYDIASLLKIFLQTLEKPLLENPMFCTKMTDDSRSTERKGRIMQKLLKTLPEPSQSVFDYLLTHMVKICKNNNNKISPHAICRTLAITFLHNSSDQREVSPKDLEIYFLVMEFLIRNKLNLKMTMTGSVHSYRSTPSFFMTNG